MGQGLQNGPKEHAAVPVGSDVCRWSPPKGSAACASGAHVMGQDAGMVARDRMPPTWRPRVCAGGVHSKGVAPPALVEPTPGGGCLQGGPQLGAYLSNLEPSKM